MTRALIISILAIVNLFVVYWVFLFLLLLDYSANGLLIPRFMLESAPITSLVLRGIIVLIEAIFDAYPIFNRRRRSDVIDHLRFYFNSDFLEVNVDICGSARFLCKLLIHVPL